MRITVAQIRRIAEDTKKGHMSDTLDLNEVMRGGASLDEIQVHNLRAGTNFVVTKVGKTR